MKQTNFITLVLILACALTAQAQIFVRSGANGDGSSWQNAFGDLPDADVDNSALKPKPFGHNGDKDPGVERKEQNLKNGMEDQ